MARTTRITYGQCLVLASPTPAYQSNENNLTGLKRVQSANVDFAFSRQRYKQIGSANYVGDVNLTNPEIQLDLNYFYSNGTNEVMLGLNVDGASAAVLSGIRKPNQSNNFYLLYGSGINNEPLLETNDNNFINNFNVLSLGNCFLNSYSIQGSLGNLVSVDASIQADNIELQPYDGGHAIPSLNPSTNKPDTTHEYRIKKSFFKNTTNQDGLITSAFAPSGIKLTLPTNNNVPGLELTGSAGSAFINSFALSFDIERVALYGFGSIYPYGRRALLPVLGQFQFSATASEFQSGDLNQLVRLDENKEVNMDFTIDLIHSGTTGLQIGINNAKFDAQSFRESINDFGSIDCNLSFSVSDTTGLRFSTPPLILSHPVDTSGPSGPLTVVATGMTPLTYKWYTSDGSGPVATTQTYSPDDGDYYCVVHNDLGSAQTNVASVL